MNVTPIPLPDPAGRPPLPRAAALNPPPANAFPNDAEPLAPPRREGPQIGRQTEIRWPRVFPGL
ncbi:MAG: hypothetical protein ACM3JG_01345 [Thiohalocapsa sp.]